MNPINLIPVKFRQNSLPNLSSPPNEIVVAFISSGLNARFMKFGAYLTGMKFLLHLFHRGEVYPVKPVRFFLFNWGEFNRDQPSHLNQLSQLN